MGFLSLLPHPSCQPGTKMCPTCLPCWKTSPSTPLLSGPPKVIRCSVLNPGSHAERFLPEQPRRLTFVSLCCNCRALQWFLCCLKVPTHSLVTCVIACQEPTASLGACHRLSPGTDVSIQRKPLAGGSQLCDSSTPPGRLPADIGCLWAVEEPWESFRDSFCVPLS